MNQQKGGELPYKLFHDQSPRKYGTGQGSNLRPLDLQWDSHLLPHVTDCARQPGTLSCYGDVTKFQLAYSIWPPSVHQRNAIYDVLLAGRWWPAFRYLLGCFRQESFELNPLGNPKYDTYQTSQKPSVTFMKKGLLQDATNFTGKMHVQSGTCIKGLFCPPIEPKLKVAFHHFHLIGLLEE